MQARAQMAGHRNAPHPFKANSLGSGKACIAAESACRPALAPPPAAPAAVPLCCPSTCLTALPPPRPPVAASARLLVLLPRTARLLAASPSTMPPSMLLCAQGILLLYCSRLKSLWKYRRMSSRAAQQARQADRRGGGGGAGEGHWMEARLRQQDGLCVHVLEGLPMPGDAQLPYAKAPRRAPPPQVMRTRLCTCEGHAPSPRSTARRARLCCSCTAPRTAATVPPLCCTAGAAGQAGCGAAGGQGARPWHWHPIPVLAGIGQRCTARQASRAVTAPEQRARAHSASSSAPIISLGSGGAESASVPMGRLLLMSASRACSRGPAGQQEG